MLTVDSLHLTIALAPLALYIYWLGLVNLSRRPRLTNGVRDTMALGLSLSGLIAAGPAELFMPEAAAIRFHGFIWMLLGAFYLLCLTLLVLMLRPRLIVYNVTIDQLRPVLANVVQELDRDARWAGDSLALPQLGVQLHLEQAPSLRNAQLVAAGAQQNFAGWRRLELALGPALRGTSGSRNPQGYMLVACATLMAAVIALSLSRDPQQVAAMLKTLLRR